MRRVRWGRVQWACGGRSDGCAVVVGVELRDAGVGGEARVSRGGIAGTAGAGGCWWVLCLLEEDSDTDICQV